MQDNHIHSTFFIVYSSNDVSGERLQDNARTLIQQSNLGITADTSVSWLQLLKQHEDVASFTSTFTCTVLKKDMDITLTFT